MGAGAALDGTGRFVRFFPGVSILDHFRASTERVLVSGRQSRRRVLTA